MGMYVTLLDESRQELKYPNYRRIEIDEDGYRNDGRVVDVNGSPRFEFPTYIGDGMSIVAYLAIVNEDGFVISTSPLRERRTIGDGHTMILSMSMEDHRGTPVAPSSDPPFDPFDFFRSSRRTGPIGGDRIIDLG